MPEQSPTALQPIVTVDVVILTLHQSALHVALARREHAPHAGEWTLPGGWVHTDEDEDALAAANRILRAKAGLESPYLEQLRSFASRHRDARGWSVSIAHYALVPYNRAASAQVQWRPVDDISTLPFDHLEILRTAVDRVRSKTAYSSLPVHLMPSTFTLTQLQQVYEQVLGTALDKRTFRRRIEELDLVEPAPGARETGAAHRPARHYRVRRRFGRELAVTGRNLA
jgi:8-oxo-dGTP diphosphatase